MIIRRTGPSDIEGLRALIVTTWHDTYDATIGPQRVDEITSHWHSPARLESETSEDICVSLVSEDEDGALLGHALVRFDSADAACLSRLYVHPQSQGLGVGGALLARCLEETIGRSQLVLEVEEANVKARAFYEKHGFAVIRRKANCGDQDGVPTLDMALELPAGRTERR